MEILGPDGLLYDTPEARASARAIRGSSLQRAYLGGAGREHRVGNVGDHARDHRDAVPRPAAGGVRSRGRGRGAGPAGGPPLALRVLAPCAPASVTRPPDGRERAQGAAESRYGRPPRRTRTP